MAKPTWIPKWLWWAKGDIVFWAIGFVLTTVKGTKFYETWNWDGAFLGVGLAIVLITTVRLVQGPKASDPPDEHPKFEWLAKMAESELQNVGSGVRVKAERIVPQLNNADGPPYIDCILSIYNGSVWPIALDKVTGSVRLNDQLLRPPEIVHNIGMSSLIQHTSAHEVIFRQWLEDGLLGVIKSSMTPMTFAFSELDLRVRVNPQHSSGRIDGHPEGQQVRANLNGVQIVLPAQKAPELELDLPRFEISWIPGEHPFLKEWTDAGGYQKLFRLRLKNLSKSKPINRAVLLISAIDPPILDYIPTRLLFMNFGESVDRLDIPADGEQCVDFIQQSQPNQTLLLWHTVSWRPKPR